VLLLLLPALLWLLLLGCFLCGCGCCCAQKPYYYAPGGFFSTVSDGLDMDNMFFFSLSLSLSKDEPVHTHTHTDTQNARQVSQILHVYAIYECKPSE